MNWVLRKAIRTVLKDADYAHRLRRRMLKFLRSQMPVGESPTPEG